MKKIIITAFLQLVIISTVFSQQDTIFYTIDFSRAENHIFQVELKFKPTQTGVADFSMAA